ncbi:hypothetical protein AYY26_19685 [Photobacterium phosphoreum]|uniref:Uncharacterized protein n=2 Tax=Vibrionaceae TaxID=641 RepID=A0A2N4UQ18_9GAMM|nr:hypothetical protein [Photobacterium phosphoreum]OBU42763.1 hypothetical protein AYY26_19685 [Photobacterium phosphoreum]PLC57117.1 hypothetical protein CIK00_15150 [Photobacterium carnosum]
MGVMIGKKQNDRFFLNLLIECVRRSKQMIPSAPEKVMGSFPNYLSNDTEVVSWERGVQVGFGQKRNIPESEIKDHIKYVQLSVNTCIAVLKNGMSDFGDVSDVIPCLELLSSDIELQLIVAAIETPVQQATGGFEYDVNTICAFSPVKVVSSHFE